MNKQSQFHYAWWWGNWHLVFLFGGVKYVPETLICVYGVFSEILNEKLVVVIISAALRVVASANTVHLHLIL